MHILNIFLSVFFRNKCKKCVFQSSYSLNTTLKSLFIGQMWPNIFLNIFFMKKYFRKKLKNQYFFDVICRDFCLISSISWFFDVTIYIFAEFSVVLYSIPMKFGKFVKQVMVNIWCQIEQKIEKWKIFFLAKFFRKNFYFSFWKPSKNEELSRKPHLFTLKIKQDIDMFVKRYFERFLAMKLLYVKLLVWNLARIFALIFYNFKWKNQNPI